MAIYELRTFKDIVDRVREELSVPAGDQDRINKIKRLVNEVYIQEVAPYKKWEWLSGNVRVVHGAVYSEGTVSVTPNTTTATLSVAPDASLGSFAGRYFSVVGFDEIYTIASHTAGSTAITLTSDFQGQLNSTVSFQIWTDRVPLPVDCRETVSVWHNRHKKPMEGLGWREMQEVVAAGPKGEGFPYYFHAGDFYDPSSGTDELDADRYRILYVYPAITREPVTVRIDYIKDVLPLEDDEDETVLPLQHVNVLVLGTLAKAWRTVARNPEEAATNEALYRDKLARMSGAIEDGFDKPKLQPNSRYLAAKRITRIGSRGRMFGTDSAGGGASYNAPSYLENVTINGAVLTNNMTVNPSVTIDGRDISADALEFEAHIAATTAHGISGSVVGTTDAQVLTAKTIEVADNSIQGAVGKLAQFNSLTGDLEASSIEESDVLTESGTNTLTNKTIDGDDNTIQDLALSSLKTDAGAADTFLSRDGSGNVISTKAVPTGDVVGDDDAQTLTNKTIVASSNTITAIADANIDAAAAIARSKIATGTNNHVIINSGAGALSSEAQLAISRGGTGQSTQTAAMDALSPTTTKGDLLVDNGTNVIRLAVGSNGNVLKANSGAAAGVEWGSAAANLNVRTVTGTDTVTSSDDVILLNPSGTMTLTMFSAVGNTGKVIEIIYIAAASHVVTIDGNGSETIGGSANVKMSTTRDRLRLASDNANLQILDENIRIQSIMSGDPASASSANPIIFPTAATNLFSAYNTTTGQYTAPRPGLYAISGYWNSAANSVLTNIYVGGVANVPIGKTDDTNGDGPVYGQIYLAEGDILTLCPNATLNLDSVSSLTITRVSP